MSRRVTVWSPTAGSRAVAPLDGFYASRAITPRPDGLIFLKASVTGDSREDPHFFEWDAKAERFTSVATLPPYVPPTIPGSPRATVVTTSSQRVLAFHDDGASAELLAQGSRSVDPLPEIREGERAQAKQAFDLDAGALLVTAFDSKAGALLSFVLEAGATKWTALPPLAKNQMRLLNGPLFPVGKETLASYDNQSGFALATWAPRTGVVVAVPEPPLVDRSAVAAPLYGEHMLFVGGYPAENAREKNPALRYLLPTFAACLLLGTCAAYFLARRLQTREGSALIVGTVSGWAAAIAGFVVYALWWIQNAMSHARFN